MYNFHYSPSEVRSKSNCLWYRICRWDKATSCIRMTEYKDFVENCFLPDDLSKHFHIDFVQPIYHVNCL